MRLTKEQIKKLEHVEINGVLTMFGIETEEDNRYVLDMILEIDKDDPGFKERAYKSMQDRYHEHRDRYLNEETEGRTARKKREGQL